MNSAEPTVAFYTDGVAELTVFTADDVHAHLAGEDEETARRFGWWPKASTEETFLRAYAEWTTSWRTCGPVQTFAVRLKASGELVGGCQLRKQPDGSGHVSYWTGTQHRGQGLARRALTLLCRHAATEGITFLEAHIEADNGASRAVAAAVGFAESSRFTDDGIPMIGYHWVAGAELGRT